MKEVNNVVDVVMSGLELYEEGIKKETRRIIESRNLLSDDVMFHYLEPIVDEIKDIHIIKVDANDDLYDDFQEILMDEVRSAVRDKWCSNRSKDVATGEV